jgi:pimeloyl-ACP methyl ester carboxylesterase
MAWLTVRGAELFYTDDGGGEPAVLLVHGWGGDSQEWCWHIDRTAVERLDLVLGCQRYFAPL